jgi:hypothetical protein
VTPEPTVYYICKFKGFNNQVYFYDKDTAERYVQNKVEKYKAVRGWVKKVVEVEEK